MSPTARHRCNVSLELCSPGAKPRRGPRHSLHASAYSSEYNEDLIFLKVEVSELKNISVSRSLLKIQLKWNYFVTNHLCQMLILTIELLLYAALVARLQIRSKTLTLALFSLNFHLPCKYVARFIVVIKNIFKIFPKIKQASSLYHLHRFFVIKGIG